MTVRLVALYMALYTIAGADEILSFLASETRRLIAVELSVDTKDFYIVLR